MQVEYFPFNVASGGGLRYETSGGKKDAAGGGQNNNTQCSHETSPNWF
jgi:hypothetical protein